MDNISQETFEKCSQKVKLDILFDISSKTEARIHELNKNLTVKTQIDKIYVSLGGFLAGTCALLLREVLKWIG